MAAVAASSATTVASQPQSTVYVRNLDERVKLPILTETLRTLFSSYGNIVDIIAKKNIKAKGQAFIIFDNPDSASRSIEDIDGFSIFDRPMSCSFARSTSDATVRARGNEEDFELHKRHRLAEKERKTAAEAQAAKLKRSAPSDGQQLPGQPLQKKSILKNPSGKANGPIPDEFLPPNKVLIVQNLPDDYDANAVESLFNAFPGFKEARIVPGRKGLAFVEYETEDGAITAKERVIGMSVGAESKTLKITFQRQT